MTRNQAIFWAVVVAAFLVAMCIGNWQAYHKRPDFDPESIRRKYKSPQTP